MPKKNVDLSPDLAQYVRQTLSERPPPEQQLSTQHELDIYCLVRLDNFISALIKTPLATTRLDSATFFGEHAPEARRLASFFRDIVIARKAYSPHLTYAPQLALFFETYLHHKVSQISVNLDQYHQNPKEHIETLNDFFTIFHRSIHTHKTLRAEHHNWRHGRIDNQENISSYLDNYILTNHDVSALHFTFFHTTEPFNLTATTEQEQKDYLRHLSKCRETLFNGFTRKPSLFPHKPGYVWSVEPHLHEGYGLRMTLLFNTTAASKDHPFLQMHAYEIGDYWTSQATKGYGRYRLHPASKAPYTGLAFDRVQVDEARKVQKLKQSIECMALFHMLVRVRNQPKGKFFGMPQWRPQVVTCSNGMGVFGVPRSQQADRHSKKQ